MRALVRHPLIDEILDARRDFARGHMPEFEGYRLKTAAAPAPHPYR